MTWNRSVYWLKIFILEIFHEKMPFSRQCSKSVPITEDTIIYLYKGTTKTPLTCSKPWDLKKIIYLEVQSIHTYPLCKTTSHLITSTKRPKNGVYGICFLRTIRGRPSKLCSNLGAVLFCPNNTLSFLYLPTC